MNSMLGYRLDALRIIFKVYRPLKELDRPLLPLSSQYCQQNYVTAAASLPNVQTLGPKRKGPCMHARL